MPEQKPSYARLIGIYESDISVEGKFVHCFLLTMEMVDGSVFMCPTYVKPNYIESVKKSLSRLTPVLYAPQDDTKDLKKEHQTVELTEVVEHTVVAEDTQLH